MPINTSAVNAYKKRCLSSTGRASKSANVSRRSSIRRHHTLPEKGESERKMRPAALSSESPGQLVSNLDLPVKALTQAEKASFLEALDSASRESMEVKVQTTMCFQRFINAGLMEPEELSDMKYLAQCLGELRDLKKYPKVVFINATELGGGVAEMRLDTIALFRDLNFSAKWLVIDGADRFYNVTVHMHEGIQNPNYAPLEPHEIETFHLTTIANFMRFEQDYLLPDLDVLWIDDPQPLGMAPLVKLLYPHILVVWRCHVHLDAEPSIRSFVRDLTLGNLHPERDHLLINFLKSRGHGIDEIPAVDIQVFHREVFANNLGIPSDKVHIMPPCINPLSFKNMELNESLVKSTLKKYGIMSENDAHVPPYVLEVSRYDPYKGPLELITAFRDAALAMPLELQREIHLVLVSSLPGDNPSGVRLARLLQEYVDALDLAGFPEDQRAGKPNDFRKRIHLLMLDDKAPWERLLERFWQLKREGNFNADSSKKIAEEVCALANMPIPDAVESLEQCGFVTPEQANHLLSDPLPVGVSFTHDQKLAMLDVLKTRSGSKGLAGGAKRRLDPGANAVTRRRAENDCLTGKEINAFEVNALQSGALITVQFSSKEGFGLTVSEALVKSLPGYEGLTVCTLVGGIVPQAEACDCFKIEYTGDEVAKSLAEYRALPDNPSIQYFQSLSSRIASRSSVVHLVESILTGAILPREERQRRSRAARQAVLANFSTWVNVRNILKGMVKAADLSASDEGSTTS